ncbi:MAG TPA: GNAT family N-acetyltransferase [Polyangiaceae bacterium]|nr:GNAT family N-acetyltransferase [Polyangiaceae bacterium]
MSALVVETLSARDIPHNLALCHAVGWPDTEAEWRVIYEAALVLGVRREGQLVGQVALGLYAGAGCLAKMVVSPSARRAGIGAAILDSALREATDRLLPVLGLVATALGRPLYESRGFEALGGVCILMGTPKLDEPSQPLPAVGALEQILAIERRFMASAREAVLRGRLRESSVSALHPEGFALATRHESGTRVGPISAAEEPTARALAMAIFRAAPGPVRVDVPAQRSAFRAWLQGLGLIEKGVNVEMARGGKLPWNVPQRFALATQAWG